MRTPLVILAAVLLIALAVAGFTVWREAHPVPPRAPENEPAPPPYPDEAMPMLPEETLSPETMSSDRIRVTAPDSGAQVKSPLTVTGEARGSWFFEASFPVRLIDSHGTEVARGVAQAQGEWMTDDFVPFTAVLEFPSQAGFGTLILENDNPSGRPETAAQLTLPVRF